MSKNRKLIDEMMSGIDSMREQREGRLKPLTQETTLLAETALAEDWLKREEEEAWAHLQSGK